MIAWLLVLTVFQLSRASSFVEYCEGKVICTNASLAERFCIVFDAIFDLNKLLPESVHLKSSNPATVNMDSILARCERNLPPKNTPILTNAFGTMSQSKIFGEMDLSTTSLSDACWAPKRHVLDYSECDLLKDLGEKLKCMLERTPEIKILINRDMSSNLFHFLYNEMYQLYQIEEQMGVSLSESHVTPLIIDTQKVEKFERETFTAITGSATRLKHWHWRPFPCKKPQMCRLCEPGLVLGVSRHWRSWLHENNSQPVLVGFARYIRKAFKLSVDAFESSNTIVIVDRANTRRISNLDELVNALELSFPDMSVKVQKFERLSVKQQLKIVADARIFIGVHGAALSWVPFLARDAMSIELLPYTLSVSKGSGFDSGFFGNLASAARIQHVAISADEKLQSKETLMNNAPMSSELVVNVQAVLAAIPANQE